MAEEKINLDKYIEEILNKLEDNEKIIKELYQVYAQKDPKRKEFWDKLGKEELLHAEWIESFRSKEKEGFCYHKARFTREALNSFFSYIKDLVNEAQENQLTDIEMLGRALDIENALIEKNFFESFEGDSVEFKYLIYILKSATEEHVERVKKALEESKNEIKD